MGGRKHLTQCVKRQHCKLFGSKPGLTQDTDNRPTDPCMPSAGLGCYQKLLSYNEDGKLPRGENLLLGISWVNFQTGGSMSVDC